MCPEFKLFRISKKGGVYNLLNLYKFYAWIWRFLEEKTKRCGLPHWNLFSLMAYEYRGFLYRLRTIEGGKKVDAQIWIFGKPVGHVAFYVPPTLLLFHSCLLLIFLFFFQCLIDMLIVSVIVIKPFIIVNFLFLSCFLIVDTFWFFFRPFSPFNFYPS